MTMGLDFGLKGRKALVCASSGGIGRGCAEALATCGADVTINGRTEDSLRAAAEEISDKAGRPVSYVVADAASDEGRAALVQACPNPDILINNAAGPPTGDFRDFDKQAWRDAVDANMIAPILLIRQVIDGMVERKWGRIINITSSAVRAPLPLLGLSNGARSGLTGFVAGLAREIANKGVTINNLLPGRIETNRLHFFASKIAESQGITKQEALTQLAQTNPMKRFGTTEEMGALCAFLCSQQAGYLTGQNYLVDGGEFPGI